MRPDPDGRVLVKVNRNSRRELGAVMHHLLRLGEPGHA